MNKLLNITGTLLLSLLSLQNTQAQKPEYLTLNPEGLSITQSLFSEVEVIDTRFDTVYMGFVQKGTFNRKVPIELTRSMTEEIRMSALQLVRAADSGKDTPLVHIRNFFLSEAPGTFSENGKFIFKAGCYHRKGDVYNLMFTVDTAIVVKGVDVTADRA